MRLKFLPLSFIDVSVSVSNRAYPRKSVISPLALIVCARVEEELSLFGDVVCEVSLKVHEELTVVTLAEAPFLIVTKLAFVLIALIVDKNTLALHLIVVPRALIEHQLLPIHRVSFVNYFSLSMFEASLELASIVSPIHILQNTLAFYLAVIE